MGVERRIRVFKKGRNQAIRIPREFELPGDEAILRKDGDRLIIEPVPPASLLALLERLEPIDEEFPEISEPALDSVDLATICSSPRRR